MTRLVTFEDVAGIDFRGDVVEDGVVAVGDDGVGLGLEGGEVVDHAAAEEGRAVLEGGLEDDDLRALGLDALHDALDGGLAEGVRAGLHREAVDADGHLALLGGVEGAGGGIVAGLAENAVRDVVLAGPVALDDGLDQVLGDVVEVREELLRVLGEAITAVAEAGVVVVGADARVEADAFDDGLRVEALHLGVGVELVEIADAQGQVGVGEELDRLRLRRAHEEDGDVLLQRALADEGRESVGGVLQGKRFLRFARNDRGSAARNDRGSAARNDRVEADDDTGGVEVVVEGLGLAEEFRSEDDAGDDDLHRAVGLALAIGELLAGVAGIADGDGRLDDHHGVRIDLEDQLDDFLDVGRVEEVLFRVVVGRGGDHDEGGVAVGGAPVERRDEVQRLLGQVAFQVLVLDRALPAVDFFDFFRDDVHGHHFVVLGEERRDAQADISGAGDCDFH